MQDSATKEIATQLTDLLAKKIGHRPHLVIMEAHRTQIDANREIRQACMGCEACEEVYNAYHTRVGYST